MKLSEDILAGERETVRCNELFCEANYQTCVGTLSLIRADKLDNYAEHFENLVAVDFEMNGDHCSFTARGGQLKLEKKPICITYINALGETLAGFQFRTFFDQFHTFFWSNIIAQFRTFFLPNFAPFFAQISTFFHVEILPNLTSVLPNLAPVPVEPP